MKVTLHFKATVGAPEYDSLDEINWVTRCIEGRKRTGVGDASTKVFIPFESLSYFETN
jgi:hypothetical protein